MSWPRLRRQNQPWWKLFHAPRAALLYRTCQRSRHGCRILSNCLVHGRTPSVFKSGCAYLLQSLRCYSKVAGLALRRSAAGRAAAASCLASYLAKRLCFAATGRGYACAACGASCARPVASHGFCCCGSTGLAYGQRCAGAAVAPGLSISHTSPH